MGDCQIDQCCRICQHGPFPAHRAAAQGRIACLKRLMTEEGNGGQLMKDMEHRTPLHVAVEFGQLECVKYLIEQAHFSAYECNAYGESSAHVAARWANMDCLKYLIGQDAKCSLAFEKDSYGNTILHTAVLMDNNDIAIWLLQRYGQTIANMSNKAGQLPLHIAAGRGNVEFIRTSTKYDSQMVHRMDWQGATPPFYAVNGGHSACVKYLMEKTRADINALTKNGQSLLHIACLSGHPPVVQWLLAKMKKGAIFQRSGDTATPAHYAALGGHTEVLMELRNTSGGKKKRVVNAVDVQGNSPLHLACMIGHRKCAEYLLNVGCDLKLKNKIGQSALDVAIQHGNHYTAWVISNFKHGKGKGKRLISMQPLQPPVMPYVPPSISTSGYGSYLTLINLDGENSRVSWNPWAIPPSNRFGHWSAMDSRKHYYDPGLGRPSSSRSTQSNKQTQTDCYFSDGYESAISYSTRSIRNDQAFDIGTQSGCGSTTARTLSIISEISGIEDEQCIAATEQIDRVLEEMTKVDSNNWPRTGPILMASEIKSTASHHGKSSVSDLDSNNCQMGNQKKRWTQIYIA